MKKIQFKTGQLVKVIAGDHFGRIDEIIKVNKRDGFVYLKTLFREKFIKRNKKEENSEQKDNLENKKKVFIAFNLSNVRSYSEKKEK